MKRACGGIMRPVIRRRRSMTKQDMAYLTAQNLYLYETVVENRARQGDRTSFRLDFQWYLGALELAEDLVSKEEASDRADRIRQRCMGEEASSG